MKQGGLNTTPTDADEFRLFLAGLFPLLPEAGALVELDLRSFDSCASRVRELRRGTAPCTEGLTMRILVNFMRRDGGSGRPNG
jgi:hypothetical protein